jgi:hypothetical protein
MQLLEKISLKYELIYPNFPLNHSSVSLISLESQEMLDCLTFFCSAIRTTWNYKFHL